MSTLFRPATRQKVRLRMAIDGVSGSGKTFTALRFAMALGKRVAVINTESGAVEKYLGLSPDGTPFLFDVCELTDYSPSKYTETILAAGAAGYDVLVIDSLSHAWAGSGGALELKDRKGGNSFTAWKDITPMHNHMIEAILHSPCHVIATMRSKTEYVLETNGSGKQVPVKVGMAPVQRAGMEYEFDLYCSIDSEHIMRVSKSRCPEVADAISVKPGASFMEPVLLWLNDGSTASADKFAATEADLRRLAKAQQADEPPAPKKTPQELMAEAAAKVEASRGGSAQAATAAASVPTLAEAPAVATQSASVPYLNGETKPPAELVCKETVSAINQVCVLLGIDEAGKRAICQKRGVVAVEQLSQDQADEILAKLSAMAVDAAAGNEGASEAGVSRASNDGPATDQQVSEIKELLSQWEQNQPGVVAEFVARLNGAGFATIANMTFDQASDLKAAVEVKNIAAFFDRVLAMAAAG
jgi:hypothetical protein